MVVRATLSAPAGTDESKAVQLMERAEHVCLISNSLNAERQIEARVLVAGDLALRGRGRLLPAQLPRGGAREQVRLGVARVRGWWSGRR